MASKFPEMKVSEALERSIRNLRGLSAKDSAIIAAARALARKIDAWDVIVDYAMEDMEDKAKGARPAVPQNDNVSIATFLKYMQALGLTVDAVQKAPAKAKSGSQKDMLADFRREHRQSV